MAAILASAVALILISQKVLTQTKLHTGAVIMGAGIATMHYIGMAAMRMHCTCLYDMRIVALSVVIAVVVSDVALASLRYKTGLSGTHKVAAAILLGIAICSMHYTGMAAAHFFPTNRPVDLSATVSVSWLGGIGIAAGTLLLLGLAILSSIADKYFSAQLLRFHSTEQRYRVLFERSLAGIYRSTVDGTIMDVNEACVELLGYRSREEVLGKKIRNAHMQGDTLQNYLETLKKTKRWPARELELVRTDGSTIWVMVSATLIDPPDGGPAEIQGMLLSIDDLKRTESELRSAKYAAESASLAKSQFLGNMSHELRTPLNGVLGMTQLLMDSGLSEDQKEYVEVVKHSAESLLNVISHILEFATSETRHEGSEGEAFELGEIVEVEVASAAPLAKRKNLKLSCEIAPELTAKFWGEPRWIRQALSGLLSNAIKFTMQGEILVAVGTRGRSGPHQMVRISVTDTGNGIAPEKQAMIFEPFNQADNSNARRFGGTGLGLSIVRNLTKSMGGQITIESEPGKGSTFSLFLPLLVHSEEEIPLLPEQGKRREPALIA